MNLQTIPFSTFDNKKKYKMVEFKEAGITINFLNDINFLSVKIPSGNLYKFGVQIDDEYFWYFNGEPIRTIQNEKVDRKKMREIYSVLSEINKTTTNVPFVFKIKK